MPTPRVRSTASPVSSHRAPLLALVADLGADPGRRLEQIGAALDEGLDWVQLRDRSHDGADLLRFADALRTLCTRAGAQLLINRRCDLALACDADGVHVGVDGADVEDLRAAWQEARGGNASPLVGVSTHSAEEALEAATAGADYVHLAPVYPPLSKHSERPPLGPGPLAALATSGVRVFAQGGIEVKHIESVIEAGAAGVAVTGALLRAPDCATAARALRTALDGSVRR